MHFPASKMYLDQHTVTGRRFDASEFLAFLSVGNGCEICLWKRKMACMIICQISSDLFNKAQSVTLVCMRSGVATRSRFRPDCTYWYEKDKQESNRQKTGSRFKTRGWGGVRRKNGEGGFILEHVRLEQVLAACWECLRTVWASDLSHTQKWLTKHTSPHQHT